MMIKSFVADNIYVNFNGDVYVTGHGNDLKFLQSAMDPNIYAPTVVSKVYENTDSDLFYGKRFKSSIIFEDDGGKVSTGSIGIISLDKKKLVIGGVMNSGLLVCDV